MKYIRLLLVAVILVLALPSQAAAAESCGADLSWTITDGTLEITGNGDMTNYTTYTKVPWYSQRKNIKQVKLPDGLTSISSFAFYGCTALTEITIPDSVLDIGADAFCDCTGLETVRLGTELAYIGDEAFFGCTDLRKLYIPENVAQIGYYAFANCTALEAIEVSDTNPSFSSDEAGCLFNKDKTTLLLAPSLLSGFYSIPDGVEQIEAEAFFECSGLTSLYIPQSLTEIGEMAFYLSEDLNHITYAGTAQQWGWVIVYEDNDYLLQAQTWHYEGKGTVYRYENCVSSGIYCSSCKAFIVKDGPDSGSHSYSSYEDLSCNSCDTFRAVIAISMKQLPEITYTLGQQELLTDGGVIEICYTDGSCATAALTDTMVATPNTAVLGNQKITVTYGGKSTAYTINVVLGTPEQLELSALPRKLQYLTDGELELAGLTLLAHYSFGTQTVTADQVSVTVPDMTTPGRKVVSVWVGERSVEFEIIVHEKMLLTLDRTSYPESTHNYSSNMNETQTMTYAGAQSLVLTFDGKSYVEDKYDYLYVLDGNGNILYTLTGKLYNQVLTVPGDTVSLQLKTDSSGTRYGYAFSAITAMLPQHCYEDGYCTVCNSLQYKVAVCEKGNVVNGADTVEQALKLCQPGQYLKLYTHAQISIAASEDLYIDLNGFDLTGTFSGGKIYGMDSTTDGYNGNSTGTMSITGSVPVRYFKTDITGPVRRYLAVQQGTGYSFHRFYLGITHLTLRPDTDGVGYKAVFYGDDAVLGQLCGMGYTMTLGGFEPRTVSTDQVISGKTITLRIDHFDASQFGQTELSAAVFLQLKDGTVITATPCTMTLRGLVEQLDRTTLTQHQVQLLEAMLQRQPIMRTWLAKNKE